MAASSISDHIVGILVDKYGYPESDVSVEADLEELDFDSLVLTELAGLLSRAYGVDLVEDELAEAGTLAAIAALVDERIVAARPEAA